MTKTKDPKPEALEAKHLRIGRRLAAIESELHELAVKRAARMAEMKADRETLEEERSSLSHDLLSNQLDLIPPPE